MDAGEAKARLDDAHDRLMAAAQAAGAEPSRTWGFVGGLSIRSQGLAIELDAWDPLCGDCATEVQGLARAAGWTGHDGFDQAVMVDNEEVDGIPLCALCEGAVEGGIGEDTLDEEAERWAEVLEGGHRLNGAEALGVALMLHDWSQQAMMAGAGAEADEYEAGLRIADAVVGLYPPPGTPTGEEGT